MAVATSDVLGNVVPTDEMAISKYITSKVRNFPKHKEQLNRFFSEFTSEESEDYAPHGKRKYLNQLV